MKGRSILILIFVVLMAGCASFPELDGKSVSPMQAAELQRSLPQEMPIDMPDLGDAGLRQMIAEADVNSLDMAEARARAMVADLAFAQAGAARLAQPSGTATQTEEASSVNLSISYEVDLSGRIAAAQRAAALEHKAAGVELMMARRMLMREIALGWVMLGEARMAAARADERVELARARLPIVQARVAAGEVTAASLTEVLQLSVAAEDDAARAQGQIALAEARLHALGARTIPQEIRLGDVRLPEVPVTTDLGRIRARPEVCIAFLQFRAADAARAEMLLSKRPRLVLTGSLNQTARTLAGLLSGNIAPLATSVALEGAILGNGEARRQVDRARIAAAQAEIAWLQAQSRGEIAILEAAVELTGAKAALDAALAGYKATETEMARSKARIAAGEDDLGRQIEAELALLEAQATVDLSRTRAVRAAIIWQDALGPDPSRCPEEPSSGGARPFFGDAG